MKAENIDILNDKFRVDFLKERFIRKELVLTKSKTDFNHIEYVMLRVPKTINIDTRDEEKWIVLNSEIFQTILDYMNDKIVIDNPKYFPEIKGLKYSELHRKFQRRIEEYQFNSILIRPNTKNEEAIDLINYLS